MQLSEFRKLISALDIGVLSKNPSRKTGKRYPCHVNKNFRVKNFLTWCINKRKLKEERPPYLERFSNAELEDHFLDRKTLYFAGQGWNKQPKTLVMIDIDCHKCGTMNGAMKYADSLIERFPGLIFEPSTNNRGLHGYFVVEKFDYYSQFVNSILKRFQNYLRYLSEGYDIEIVEIKGTAPEIEWDNGELDSYKSGQLAKIPRDISCIEKTWTIDVMSLMKLVSKFELETKYAPEKHDGSCGLVITEDDLAALDNYRSLATSFGVIKTTSRAIVTAEDIAIFMLLLVFFTENPNPDQTLPVNRFKELWQSLIKNGDITRGFDCHRFKAIRDRFSSLDLIDWIDSRFIIGERSSKWTGSELFVNLLDVLLFKGGEERDTLLGTNSIEQILLDKFGAVFTETNQTISPQRMTNEGDNTLSPTEITDLLFAEHGDGIYADAKLVEQTNRGSDYQSLATALHLVSSS